MAEKPWLAKGLEGSTVCGVGIRKAPSGSFEFNRARATGLMFDPSSLTVTPPFAVGNPANSIPRLLGVRSSVNGGEYRFAVQAILA